MSADTSALNKNHAVQRAYNTEKLTMTTTHNVTELQPRMTREQLIDVARNAAKYLPVASAQIMNELANRLDYTSVALCEAMEQRKSLAIENTVLREDVTSWAKECDRIVERYTKTRSNMHLLEAQRELRDLTPTTSAFLAEVRASAIKSALDDCSEYLDRDCIMESNGISYDDAALREIGAMALQEALLHKGAAQ